MRRDGTENRRGRREGERWTGGKAREREREEGGGKRKGRERGRKKERTRGREENEEKRRPRAMHTLPSRRDGAMGRRETAAVSGQERDRREEGKNAFVDCSIE